jgi:hypothetical protein
MNKTAPFIFNDKHYYAGTVVKIKEEWKQCLGFNSMLQFTGYMVEEKLYYFTALHDNWEIYRLSKDEMYKYIECVLKVGVIKENDRRVEPKYIEGIVSAWIWYILAMIFAIFLKGAENVIMTWGLATFIFFNWRNRKIKGG